MWLYYGHLTFVGNIPCFVFEAEAFFFDALCTIQYGVFFKYKCLVLVALCGFILWSFDVERRVFEAEAFFF
jgi:hypothetical protein